MTPNVRAPGTVVLCTLAALAGAPAPAVQSCPNATACAQLSVDSVSATSGETVQIGVAFQQGPDDGREGGIDAITALAMTINFAGNTTRDAPALADCTADSNGLPNSVHADAALSAFHVVIQNAYCTAGHTHCLCPDALSGIAPDSFINIAIFAPTDLTTFPIVPLPTGHLLSIDLHLAEGASGSIPLHVFAPWTDDQHPPSTALVSLGDTLRVDQTCQPQANATPCSGADAIGQLAITDGAITVIPPPTATVTETPTPTLTATPTQTSTPTSTASPTDTASATATASETLTPSASPTPSPSQTSTLTASETVTPSSSTTDTPTATSSSTATATASITPSNTATLTPSGTVAPATTTPPLPTATDTPVPVPSSTPPRRCLGDCNGNGMVTVDEIVTMLDIALGNVPVSVCSAGDLNADGQITVDEIVAAVARALNGC